MAVVPIADLGRKMPEQGRIRAGRSNITQKGKTPVKLRTFRFTSHDENALQVLATAFGGTVRPWADPSVAAGQYELLSNTASLNVVLPPDPLGGTPLYELWSGGGLARRCNGVTCEVPQQSGPDSAEYVENPCICLQRQKLACKPTTRLNVILRDVPFGGTWRLESHGKIAAQELPGMVDMLRHFQQTGLTSGVLRLVERHTQGNRRHFVVPVLGLAHSIDELVAGSAQLGALANANEISRPSMAALMPADTDSSAGGWDLDDDDPLGLSGDEPFEDAEIVEDGEADSTPDPSSTPSVEGGVRPRDEDPAGVDAVPIDTPPSPPSEGPSEAMRKKLHATINEVRARFDANRHVDEWRHALVKKATDGRTESSSDLTTAEMATCIDVLEDLLAGRRRYMTIDGMGVLRVSARKET